MFDQQSFDAEQRAWLADQFDAVPSEVKVLRPSEWAEQHRYLPPTVTPMPGPYRFDVAPYLREPLDCLAVDSPIRSLAFMKGAQICATVGILENFLGYLIEHVRTSPVMLVTADAELAQLRVEANILPMLQASGLSHLIKSADEGNARKTGKTEKKIEWDGGGYLVPIGAQNANKLRSISVEVLLQDERDAWPAVVGKDGDPGKLVVDRTAAYEQSRKIAEVSTPLIHGQSKIAEAFERGDQRRYFVCCLACGFAQVLRWRHVDGDGVVSGIAWKMDGGRLVPGSVRYLCQKCGHAHTNDDKTRLLAPENGAEWRPTAQAASPHHRSYHLSALYSPVGMQSWETCVEKWLEAWDVENNRPRDLAKLQVFYNNVLGEPFELRGEKVRLDAVSSHRRAAYKFGQVPNEFAKRHCLSPILIVTAAVDVHGDQLPYAAFGWCRDRRAFLLDYRRLEGNTDSLDDPGTWGALREELTHRTFAADDGKRYRIQMAMVDSGYRTDHVYRFASEFRDGVFPVKGREQPTKNVLDREIHLSVSATGARTLLITVDRYKDRLSSALRREWDGFGVQPPGHFNAPSDVTEKQLRELTVETKVPRPGKLGGYEWRRPSGAANELWDLYVYNSAALDLVALDVCKNQLELDGIDWPTFWDVCETQRPYFEAA